MEARNRKLLVIVGPTAVGKSALAVELGRKYNGEVISADSRQVYSGLDIGTGKITKKEMGGVPHHLLDVVNPKKQFSVAEYQKLAEEKLGEIFTRSRLPIIVGGTGQYIDAIVQDVVFPEVPPDRKLRAELEKKTVKQLFSLLYKLDARRAKTIDASNPRRLTRAIEIATALGNVPSFQNTPRTDIDSLFIGLILPKEVLKKRIAFRLHERVKKGMLHEVRELHARGLSWKRMEELGLEYRFISRYLRGFLSKKEMIEKLQSRIWHYAKRQMAWFKRDTRIKWFPPKEFKEIAKKVGNFLKG